MDIIDENKNCPYISRCTHVDCGKFCLKRFKTEYYFESAFIPKDRRIKQPLRIGKCCYGRYKQGFCGA